MPPPVYFNHLHFVFTSIVALCKDEVVFDKTLTEELQPKKLKSKTTTAQKWQQMAALLFFLMKRVNGHGLPAMT